MSGTVRWLPGGVLDPGHCLVAAVSFAVLVVWVADWRLYACMALLCGTHGCTHDVGT